MLGGLRMRQHLSFLGHGGMRVFGHKLFIDLRGLWDLSDV